MIRSLRSLLAGLLALSAAACTTPLTNGEEQAIAATDRFPIVVEPRVVTLAVAVDEGMQRLAPGEAERVRAFALRWQEHGEGLINAATPAGAPNEGAASAGLHEIQDVLSEAGVPADAITVSSYRGGNDPRAPITLSFVALAANVADCGLDWSDNLAFTPRNQPWPEFGCATQRNLAAMVADPRDLIEPKPVEPADGERRATVFERYRQGQPTQTMRTEDDSGTVARSVQ